MTTYVLDIETEFQRDDEPGFGGCPYSTKYLFKIDTNGNVNISSQSSVHTTGQGSSVSGIKNIININDNIPVPKYFINIIKSLILQTTIDDLKQINNTHPHYFHKISYQDTTKQDKGIQKHVYKRYWEMVIDTILKIKQEIKNIIENPEENLDIEIKMQTYISKTQQQQEQILELEKNIENIQTVYLDILNDNKKIKEINQTLKSKITELEIKLNEEISKTNNKKQLEEQHKLEQKRLEEKEKEYVWNEYKKRKNNYNPLNY